MNLGAKIEEIVLSINKSVTNKDQLPNSIQENQKSWYTNM